MREEENKALNNLLSLFTETSTNLAAGKRPLISGNAGANKESVKWGLCRYLQNIKKGKLAIVEYGVRTDTVTP